MRRWFIALLLGVALAGCGDPAKDLYETAQFEEKQFNLDHARQLYGEIMEKYPASPYAVQARERLKELEQK